jgi:hypothetical protein
MNSTVHLTQPQFYDLLIAGPSGTSPELERLRDHLLRCPACAAELASLRQPLADFRSSVTAWASHHSANRLWNRSSHSHPFSTLSAWLLAAAALLLLIALPFATHHDSSPNTNHDFAHSTTHSPSASSTTVGDEALLEEIDQTVSSSVPAPMQPLADPTGVNGSKIDSTSRN